LITPEQMPHKYKHEIHANEIVLLAYYIAAINIEAVYHSIVGGKYQPFEGILLTDTFQMYESSDTLDAFFPDNSERRKRQKKLDIRVIVGNPPYSAGQKNENDNNQNVEYAALDQRIRETYAFASRATLQKGLYDSYIRAIRWASDRIGNSGVIGFVTNAGFMEANTADGLRKCLAEEFSSIYVFHLRGNQRTSGEHSRREGGKIFGSGSRSPIAVSLFVKNGQKQSAANIRWLDIGDYLSREEKLERVESFGSLSGVTARDGWMAILPNEEHDWINQREDSFTKHICLGDKRSTETQTIFINYSQGVLTARDAWTYNASQVALIDNMKALITFYNSEVTRYTQACDEVASDQFPDVEEFLSNDNAKISWTGNLRALAAKRRQIQFRSDANRICLYRPFTKRWQYFDRQLNERVYQIHSIFPKSNTENLVICITGKGESHGFSALMSDVTPDFKTHYNSQCFPLYLYNSDVEDEGLLSRSAAPLDAQYSAVSTAAVELFRMQYSTTTPNITGKDVFYYIYGILHSPDYRTRYGDNLSKELPRIPAVKKFEDFQKFAQAGRDLAHWHLNYETVKCHPVTFELSGNVGKLSALKPEQFRVVKMKHPKRKDPATGKSVNDKSTVIYNEYITVTGIPLEAYDYVVNGKPAIDWVMERQAVTTDKASGIVNDANLWATETMNNPRYPLELLQRVITVSLETMKIVNNLPKLEIE
ncbi:MAG: DEAD/DEAH box helicase, partial [Planctomycetales bacterium]|nr:DEAD/DEAH box helicase [Planctomycetales bacterium]